MYCTKRFSVEQNIFSNKEKRINDANLDIFEYKHNTI